MKTILAAAVLLTSASAMAQTSEESASVSDAMAADHAELTEMYSAMFASEPLSPEQEARVPLATEVVALLFPPGTYAKMINETMAPMFDTMFGAAAPLSRLALAEVLGVDGARLSALDESELTQALEIVDPAHEQRAEITGAAMLDVTGELMNEVEPAYREGLAHAYAARFETADLEALKQFFATSVGGRYAEQSFLVYSDPKVMSAMTQVMPRVIELVPQMMERMAESMEALPEPRDVSDLSPQERERLAGLLGMSVADLEAAATEVSGDDESF
ncbi:hypothetical protein [Pelagerythrobacter sp.]|uniref:hypothetical protein n=1 Tax=Pelagerythrobacter sp. TaxID=2800702 RepID=UPI0035B4C7F4